ncbi:MAG: hypothetical protein ABS36_18790 [Acidobacteria bacterium SCN 69-37]|nr:MAG: hypothetical protein ABS36_18790 [Acidobacteria bacterium SCN 69-37]
MNRQALTPSSALPMAYFVWAHLGLALACLVLAVEPSLPGGYFLHPRMVAVVHLVTIAWISGSILGAFYVVAPLALGLPLPVRAMDWIAFVAFAAGTTGMVTQAWSGQYGLMAWSACLVLFAVVWQGGRAILGMRRATAPWPVLLHVLLAFVNMTLAAGVGMAIGFDRAYGLFGWPPVEAAYAHAHLAAIGWPVMMVVGLAYRLVPMFLPAKMPTGSGLAVSAWLLELGLIGLVAAWIVAPAWLPVGALVIVAGLMSFVSNMRAAVRQRLPRPPALPSRDWSTWQTHMALLWLIVAAGLGLTLALMSAGPAQIRVAWVYGVAGLVGFIAQIVVGIQGRLVPLYAYYRAMAALGGQPPARPANQLPTARFAKPIFALWTIGVPWLALGLAAGHPLSIRLGAIVLLGGVVVGARYLVYLMQMAR